MKINILIPFLAFALASCITRDGKATPQKLGEQRVLPVVKSQRIPVDWEATKFSKVVGYRFRIPGPGEEGDSDIFTLCRNGEINTEMLEKLKEAKGELSLEQSNRCLNTIFSSGKQLPHVACYTPHHIFIFYGGDGQAERAIEICFQCNGVITVPALSEDQWRKHDMIGLAQLCAELGIWPEDTNVDDYVPVFTEAYFKRQKKLESKE